MPAQPNTTTAPAEPFLSKAFVTAADELLTLSHFGPSVIIVHGPEGAGKTRLFEYLATVGDDTRLIRIDAGLELTDTQVLAAILQQLNRFDAVLELGHVKKLLQHAALTKPTAILVDAAERLPAHLLQMLCELVAPLDSQPEHGLRLLLLTRQTVDEFPWPTDINKAALQSYQLAPLRPDEVPSYLAHVLALPVKTVNETYGKRRLDHLYQRASGWPGQILKLLHSGARESRRTAGSSTLRWLLVGVGVCLIVAGATSSLWWPALSGISSERPQVQVSIKKAEKSAEASIESEQIEAAPMVSEEGKSEQEVLGQDLMDASEQDVDTAPRTVAQETSDVNMPPQLDVEDTGEITSEDARAQQTSIEPSEENSPLETSAEDSAMTAEENGNASVLEVETESLKFTDAEQWLLDQPEGHFVLQLAGLRQEQDMQAFMAELPVPTGKFLGYYRSPFGDDIIFKLVLAPFDSKADARAWLAKEAPPAIRKLKPWIKALSVVQTEIRQAVK